MKVIIENYDGIKGYFGLQRFSVRNLEGKKYLIDPLDGFEMEQRLLTDLNIQLQKGV